LKGVLSLKEFPSIEEITQLLNIKQRLFNFSMIQPKVVKSQIPHITSFFLLEVGSKGMSKK
jgi:hypothetical protein